MMQGTGTAMQGAETGSAPSQLLRNPEKEPEANATPDLPEIAAVEIEQHPEPTQAPGTPSLGHSRWY